MRIWKLKILVQEYEVQSTEVKYSDNDDDVDAKWEVERNSR